MIDAYGLYRKTHANGSPYNICTQKVYSIFATHIIYCNKSCGYQIKRFVTPIESLAMVSFRLMVCKSSECLIFESL